MASLFSLLAARRTILDNHELAGYLPALRFLSFAFVAASVAGLVSLHFWGLLEVPLWQALLAPAFFSLHVFLMRGVARIDPRRYYVHLIVSSTLIALYFVLIVREPVGTILIFIQPIYFAEMLFFSTPRNASKLFGLTAVALVAIRFLKQGAGNVLHWQSPSMDLAVLLWVLFLLTLCYVVIWLLSHLMWKQKQRIEAASLVLEQAYQELRALERSRSELLASVTHELKTPLVTVRGYIDLALRGELQSPVRSGLQVARRSALRLQRLIEELLIAADPQKLGSEFVFGEVRLHDLLGEEIANFSNQAASQDVTIIQVSDSKQDTIWADRERVGQVISNLINNALRYSPEGGVIEVGARSHSAADMLVWVSDQGRGIEPEKLKHLFEEHYVRGTESKGERGMGLGLLICKKMVTAMGGRLSVASQPGVGTTFSVTFPRKSAEAQAPSTEAARPKRALVLDDETDVLSLMEYHLVTAGYEIALFQNGTAAYESAMREEYDLLFLDVNVPGITGVEVSRRLREAGRPGRILLFSALIRNDAERLLVEARADGFLPKPFDFEQISAVLSEAQQAG